MALVRLRGSTRHYPWGSPTAIPNLIGAEPDGRPVAELWFGAHPSAPSVLADEPGTDLRQYLLDDSREKLGGPALARFGQHLPYLVKLIAPSEPLSLQVHPHREQARDGFAAEEAAGIPRDAPERLYPDPNHKPELLYALSEFRALSGFRTPRRALELVQTHEAPLAQQLAQILRQDPTAHGMARAMTTLLTPGAVTAADVDAVVQACTQRQGAGGASVRIDRIVGELGTAYPGDAGAVAALLLNPVTLHPGEAMFVPAGTPHAYLEGLGVEVMANSDNVLRAGLTTKHIDQAEVLKVMNCTAAPPVRIAPERVGNTRVYYAPVEDFELSITTSPENGWVNLTGGGPRIVLVLSGQGRVRGKTGEPMVVGPGDGVFVPAGSGVVKAEGALELVQAAVP